MSRLSEWLLALLAALLALLVWAALSQLPALHRADVGGADAAYVQGFGEREQADAPLAVSRPYLAGATNARALTEQAALLFPQAGTPATLALRWRSAGTPLSVTVLLNGQQPIGTLTVPTTWTVATLPLTQPQTKLSGDWFVAFQSTDPQSIYLDAASYATLPAPLSLPIMPASALMLIAGALAGLLPRRWRWWRAIGAALLAVAAMALLYRWPPPLIPYPVRRLPVVLLVACLAAYVVRLSPGARSFPRLAEIGLIGGGLLVWAAWIWWLQSQHLVLALPGVEADFSVFARRSASWDAVWRADGFYQLGYPLLLRIVRPLVQDSPFLAARLVAVASALVTLLALWLLARQRWGRLVGGLALLMAGLSPMIVQYALQIGTDMPFAAACMLTLLALLHSPGPISAPRRRDAALAGAGAGLAFVLRHPGLILLPIVIWWLWRHARTQANPAQRPRARLLAPLIGLAGFLLAASPQLVVNIRDTGQPLYSQQAKNIWLAVYGNTEYRRWDEERNEISLLEVIRRDPPRFASNWWSNLVAFSGSGGGRAAEFERAVQLRLLGWPFNLLALAGLAAWALGWRREQAGALLLLWSGLYVLGVSIGFLLPRFVLPLSPVYALAAATLLARLTIDSAAANPIQQSRTIALLGLLIALIAAPQALAGAAIVLDSQIADERTLAQALIDHVPADQPVGSTVDPRTAIAKYSAVAHRFAPITPETRWLIAEGAPPDGWQPVARSGRLGLYRR